ncbi:hypothetical protein AVEN_19476-1 [Araneus ventricosus]|uniref:Uncharacterized protein n=1 Tax=Araneus ventricosus TaxID=182803 RepID=A0A4Y2TL62_ARAVE|nr:hypothetical protein AVEN_19476-1 [Araneus ventricosus]
MLLLCLSITNSNFKCGDPTIYRMSSSTAEIFVALLAQAFLFRLLTLTLPKYRALLLVHFHPAISRSMLSFCAKEIDNCSFVLIWSESIMQGNRKQLPEMSDIDAKPLTTQVQLGIPHHLSASINSSRYAFFHFGHTIC